MAKSYCYLTNIACSLINFNKKILNNVKAKIIFLNKKHLFKT